MNASTSIGNVTQNLFLQMEEERERQPHVLREDFIPVFVTNLLRDNLCPSEESTVGTSTFRLAIRGNNPEKAHKESSEKWTDDSFMEEYVELENSFLLSCQTLEFVHRVLTFAKEAIKLFQVDSRKLLECIVKEIEFPSLELLWLLDAKYRLISLSNYLMMLKRTPHIQYIQRQFLALCFSSNHFDFNSTTRDRYTSVLEHFFHTFLISAYCNPGEPKTLKSLQDMMYDVFFQLNSKLVNISSVSDATRRFVLTVVQEVRVPNSVKKKYYSHQLKQLLISKGNDIGTKSYSLDEVIQYQERFAGSSNCDDHAGLIDVILGMIGDPMLPADVLQVISTSIRHPSRNWDIVLVLITEWLRKVEFEAASLLKEMIKILMREGISSKNEDLVSLAFILARHSSLVSPTPKVFPRYEIWYAEMFSEHHSPAKDLDTFYFLSTLLTRWIPFEPSCFLQVQAIFWPFIPKTVECKATWKSYVDLAKIRVAEYNEVEEAMALEPKPNNPVLHDVEMAIKDYETTRNVPLSVGQMLLFNKKYYMEQFLPTLLKKPTATVLSDARLRLIEALNQKDKIPREMYMAYKKSK